MRYFVSKVDPVFNRAIDLHGNTQELHRNDVVKLIYMTEDAAVEAAKMEARKNPGTQYAVFSISSIWETGEPKFIQKKVNENGEIVGV